MVVCYNTNQGGEEKSHFVWPSGWKQSHFSTFLLVLFPFHFCLYHKVSSETHLWPRSVTDHRSGEHDKQAVESHCSQLCEVKDPLGRRLYPRSVTYIEMWTQHRAGGDCKRRFGKRWEGKKGTKLVILIGFLESTQNDILNPQYSVKQLQAV